MTDHLELLAQLKKHNEQSLRSLEEQNRFIVSNNPHFFSNMESFGFQTFNYKADGNRKYLCVDRSIVHGRRRIELPLTAVYEVSAEHVIGRISSIRKKVSSINMLLK